MPLDDDRWRSLLLKAASAAALLSIAVSAAQAQTRAPCDDLVTRWVAAASADLDLVIEPVSCPPGLARLRLHPEGSEPMDVEVSRRSGPAFRRLGDLALSPIVDVEDYQALPAPQRQAFEALADWAEREQDRVLLSAGPTSTPLGWPWLLGALALGLWGAGPAPTVGRRERRWLFGLWAVALASRALFGLWAPLHVNGQGPLWLEAAITGPSRLATYGPGYAELLGPLSSLGGDRPDLAIFAANLLLGSIVAPLGALIARQLGARSPAALTTGALLVLDPVAVRIAASEAYFLPITALWALASLLLARGAHHLDSGRWRRALATHLAAGVVLALTARVHPVSWPLIAMTPALIAAGASTSSALWKRALSATGVVTAAAVLFWTTTSAVVLGQSAPAAGGSISVAQVIAHLLAAPPIGEVLVVTGAVIALGAWSRRRPALLALWALGVVWVTTRGAYGQSELWQASYDRLYLPALAVAVALSRPGLTGRTALAVVAIWVTAVVMLLFGPLTQRTTEQREYRLLVSALSQVPETCRVGYIGRAGRRVVEVPRWIGSSELVDIGRGEEWSEEAGGCRRFLRTSICSSTQGQPLCDQVLRDLEGEVIEERRFPAVPSQDDLPYNRSTVRVALFGSPFRR